jgi:hypothetical protein
VASKAFKAASQRYDPRVEWKRQDRVMLSKTFYTPVENARRRP